MSNFDALADMHQQAVHNRHSINIEDIAPAPLEVWSTPRIEEILQTPGNDGRCAPSR
jgi:hypothetical protein